MDSRRGTKCSLYIGVCAKKSSHRNQKSHKQSLKSAAYQVLRHRMQYQTMINLITTTANIAVRDRSYSKWARNKQIVTRISDLTEAVYEQMSNYMRKDKTPNLAF